MSAMPRTRAAATKAIETGSVLDRLAVAAGGVELAEEDRTDGGDADGGADSLAGLQQAGGGAAVADWGPRTA
jgi:hypothetical protein